MSDPDPAPVTTAPPVTTVFVYGTLLPGERNAHVAQQGGVFTAWPAILRGYQLLHLHPEGYPALIPGQPIERVTGMALTYAPQDWPRALPFLDELEGLAEVPPLYTRQLVELDLPGSGLPAGGSRPAWVYLYARATRLQQPGVSVVAGGDWRSIPGRQQWGPDER